MNIAAMLRPRILQELRKLNLTFPSAHCITTRPKSCVRRFSRCHATALSCCPQYYKSPTLTRSEHCRTIRTSSLSRKLSSLNDAFSETNKTRLVKQLGMMKPRKSLLATCSEEAAVFVPFCLVDSVPSVLFTLRSSQLNSHRGEVSFPGGKKDPEDKNLVETAVREMEEELGLERSHVHIWAPMPAIPDKLGKTAITAVTGFIGELDVNSLKLNHEEVESVFALSLDHVCNPANCGYTKFKSKTVLPVFLNGPHRVWGLTAIILEQVLLVVVPQNYKCSQHRV